MKKFICCANHSKSKPPIKVSSSKYDLYYKMNHKHRGHAVIFNHENFLIPKLNVRNGTHEDRRNLEKCLRNLGFMVKYYDDPTTAEIFRVVSEYSKKDHSECDCFVMCILTHGDAGVLYSKDTPYEHEQIFEMFTADKCETLAGKPKIFFLQACQGDRLDPGVRVTEIDASPSYKIPIHADFLIAYSTIPGYYSWRNTTRGSWFIQCLCNVLEEFGTQYDLLTMLTLVNQKVGLDFESNVPGDSRMHAQKQIPYITFMLMRLILFSPKQLTSPK